MHNCIFVCTCIVENEILSLDMGQDMQSCSLPACHSTM